MNLEIKELPDYEVAYVRHVGSYSETSKAWSELAKWASEKGIYDTQYFIGISLDNPQFVDEHACRYDACITLPKGFEKNDEAPVNYQHLKGGTYVMYEFRDTLDKFSLAYEAIFAQWLPTSEYEIDNRPILEFCLNNPNADPEGKAIVDLYIPIKIIA
ncbi:AraC family transcriptional regulator [Bacillus solimangrovi]|uniref:AraC effector-binding domain-containing protein n=1 Tax=Bacillus solimangrovi TaxID=1305675 RepID=A0A1E5LJ85_9BACI|nr:GyrI-like domain-containing protein [Bacillus solimangrovi]OEH94159.1 hypothetical protein BFG57_08890 [Bacillus solimangrovi]